jgi:hypothetical protein
MVTFRMGSKGTMVLLWCVAISAVVIVGTQSAARTWLAYSWVIGCLTLAVVGTVMYRIGRKQQRRWDAGDYD